MIGIIYFIVIVLANTVGALSGMGGGVIIKPVFDMIHYHPIYAISFYSSVAVLTMSVVSTYRQIRQGISLKWGFAILLSVGSIIGGTMGNMVFDQLLTVFPSGKEVQLIQIALTIVTLGFSYIYSLSSWQNFNWRHPLVLIFGGWLLGFLASLLGIGGGPINVAVLMYFFNLPIKDSTVYSIVIIFFSQLAKVSTIAFGAGFGAYDLSLLWYIIPAAVIGGFLGSTLSGKLSSKNVSKVYRYVIILVLLINIYNAWQLM